jgi:hypothetical protein
MLEMLRFTNFSSMLPLNSRFRFTQKNLPFHHPWIPNHSSTTTYQKLVNEPPSPLPVAVSTTTTSTHTSLPPFQMTRRQSFTALPQRRFQMAGRQLFTTSPKNQCHLQVSGCQLSPISYVPNVSPIRTKPSIDVQPCSLKPLHVPSKFPKRMVDVILQQFSNQLYIAKHHYDLGDYVTITHAAKIVFHHRTFIWLEFESIAGISFGERSMKNTEDDADVLQRSTPLTPSSFARDHNIIPTN